MTERAAHLVDAVLPWVPVRQWVLTVPYRLRYQMAWNHGLSCAVLRVYTRALLDVYARGARERGIASGPGTGGAGPRAGARVRRLGDARDTAAAVTSRGPRQAHLEGFDLHANVWVSANDRTGLERLAQYVLRPPFAQERLRRRSDGRIALELKTAWHDGTRELVFEPLEFLERLAAMTPTTRSDYTW
jgi:Putative transposase